MGQPGDEESAKRLPPLYTVSVGPRQDSTADTPKPITLSYLILTPSKTPIPSEASPWNEKHVFEKLGRLLFFLFSPSWVISLKKGKFCLPELPVRDSWVACP